MRAEGILSGSVAFSHETSNDALSCVLCIKGIAQLLPDAVVLLFQREGLQHEGVPLVLQSVKERWDGGRGRWSRRGSLGV